MGLVSKIRKLFTTKPRRGSRRNVWRAESLESRELLTATLNGLADGRVIYSGSALANTLTIGYNGTSYSFNDTGENIQLLGTVAGGTGNLSNTITFNPASLAAFTQLIISTGNGDDTIIVNGFRSGQEGLVVNNAIGDGSDTLSIVADLGTAGSRIQSVGVNVQAETLNVGGDIFTNNLSVNLGATNTTFPINLTDHVTVNSGTQTTAINTGALANGLNGAFDLTVSAGNVQLRGDLGTNTALNSLTATATNAAGQVQVGTTGAKTNIASAGNISLSAGTGGVLFNSDTITSSADILVTSAISSVTGQAVAVSGDNVTFTGAISGSQNVSLIATAGTVAVGGNIALTAAGAIVGSATTTIDLNGSTSAAGGITLTAPVITSSRSLQSSAGSVSVNGNITFDGVGDLTIQAGTANSIAFSGSVTGNGANLALQQANIVSVLGAVTGVNAFSISKAIAGTIADATVGTITAQTIAVTATTIHTQSDLNATVGGIALTGAVLLDGADSVITFTSGLGLGDSITITGTVNDDVAGSTSLELIAGDGSGVASDGAVTLASTGIIGGTTAILSLRANGSVVTLRDVFVTTGNILLEGGEIALLGDLNGSGGANSVVFAPNATNGTLEVYNTATSPSSGNMTIDKSDLSRVTGTIEKMVFGSNSTGNVTFFPDADPLLTTGSLSLTRNVEFRGNTVTLNESIDQNSFMVDCFANTLNVNQPIVDVGAVTFTKLSPGGTFVVNGNFGQAGWGANDLAVNNLTGAVTMNGHFGGLNVATVTVNAVTLNTVSQNSAIEANGDVTLNVTTLNENGGVYSTTGNVFIGGNVVSTAGPLTFLVPAGKDFTINGSVTAAGNISIRGRNAAIANVNINGNVVTTGTFNIDSSGAQTATNVNIDGVSASGIVMRGVNIGLGGNLTATAGSVHVLGATTLQANVVMTSSGLGTHFVRIDGAINGAFNLESQSGLGITHFVGEIGGVTPLANMLVRAGRYNFIYQNIMVTGTFDWQSGDTANAGQDVINVLAGKTITAGTSIILEADSVIVNQLTQLFAPIENVVSNGNP